MLTVNVGVGLDIVVDVGGVYVAVGLDIVVDVLVGDNAIAAVRRICPNIRPGGGGALQR